MRNTAACLKLPKDYTNELEDCREDVMCTYEAQIDLYGLN